MTGLEVVVLCLGGSLESLRSGCCCVTVAISRSLQMDIRLVSDVPRSGALVRVLCGVRLEELGVGPAVLDWG